MPGLIRIFRPGACPSGLANFLVQRFRFGLTILKYGSPDTHLLPRTWHKRESFFKRHGKLR